MEINKNPLQYFEDLLEYDKTNKLKDLFIAECIAELGNSIEDIDNEKGIVKYWCSYFDEQKNEYFEGFTTSSFEISFNIQINSEYKNAKVQIQNIVFEIISKGNNPTAFLNLQMTILKSLYLCTDKYYLEIPIVKNAIVALKNHLHNKYDIEIPKLLNQKQNTNSTTLSPDDYSLNSFCWDALTDIEREEQLQHLYILLTENPAVIESTQEDFINAFSQKKMENGIKWLIIGKNRQFSKSALFYFVNFLNDETYINKISPTELNKKVEYIFRDNEGNYLKNIRQSKNYSSTTPAGKERLDIIFSQIL